MSVFFKNNCQYSNCKKNFYTLKDLIIHIENDHLDFDPYKIEQLEEEKPETIPFSYVLKYGNFEDEKPQDNSEILYSNESVIEPEITNNNYLACDTKVERLKCVKEEIPGNQKLFTLDNSQKKPFACNMPGCEKRYKNVNGIKYHYKKHHKLCASGDPKPVYQAPQIKKSLLKYKSLLNKTKLGIPLLSCAPQTDMVYHIDENELPQDYFYKYTMPTSDFHVSNNQVPLPTMSFNYYNVSDGDIEDFSEKNSAVFA